jgi:NAD(P)-dependent dehydrogenase (short-subunit alcohol dehydrogenase family)
MLLQGKNALVTGGAAGIGKAICERLSAEGARVVIADRNVEKGKAFERDLRGRGADAWFIEFDAANLPSIDELVARSIQEMGSIEVLVNNAGVSKRIGILDLSEADWDWMQAINSKGMFFCLQSVATHMKKNGGGKIVNMSSTAAKGAKGTSNACYAASKATALIVARVAAHELGRFGINVNSVCPGPTKTELMDRIEAADPKLIVDMVENSSMGRMSIPDDIAGAVLFLCSALADNITGQSVNVDGGILWD